MLHTSIAIYDLRIRNFRKSLTAVKRTTSALTGTILLLRFSILAWLLILCGELSHCLMARS